MATILLKFANKNAKFCLCATVQGTAIRHYKVVENLQAPNFANWDSTSQRFTSRSNADKINNKILDEILGYYQHLLDTHEFDTGKELFGYKVGTPEPKKSQTVGHSTSSITLREWLEIIIEEIKNPSRLKPSASYQGYLTLLHRLEKEKTLLGTPVSDLNDEGFVHLIKWVNSQKGKNGKGNNFIGLMKMFRATISRAKKARLTTYTPDFPYMDYAPIHKVSDKAKDILENGGTVKSLSQEQFEAFVHLDLSDLKWHGLVDYWRELYRDFCVLLYEIKSRPIDVIKLHWENIAFDESTGRYTCAYIPAKKKNYGQSSRHTSSALVVQYLSDKAVEIIMKYKGQSKGGYVFPFALNNRKWNLDNPEDFHEHYYRANHVCGRINRFLHKIGKHLGIPFQLTLYAFRRTAITQAIIDNKIPLPMIAKMAGTSIEMMDKHYTNFLYALASY